MPRKLRLQYAGALLGEHGIGQDTREGRETFEAQMERRCREESDPEMLKTVRRGWCLGSEVFKREMLGRMTGKLGEHHAGELIEEVAKAKADGILAEELQRRCWGEEELARRSKSDPDKLEIAARLRRETTLSIKAIAARVQLGTSKAANAKLHKHMGRRAG